MKQGAHGTPGPTKLPGEGVEAAASGPPTATSGFGSASSIGHYLIGHKIGEGTFGKVRIAEHKLTGHKVAVKILNKRRLLSQKSTQVQREIRFLKLFRHPHIVRLYEVIDTPSAIYMIMEYVQGGELFKYIQDHGPRLDEGEARQFFQHVISAVGYCHKHLVVHRDIKPENLLLDKDGNVKLADFGLSNFVPDGHFMQTLCGSPHYAAPELVTGRMYQGPPVDVWSCGVLLYTMLAGQMPFDHGSIHFLFELIRKGEFAIPDCFSPPAADLIRRMLIVEPTRRITIQEIKSHPWFDQNVPAYLSFYLNRDPAAIDEIDETLLHRVEQKYTSQTSGTPWSRELCIDQLRRGEMTEFTVAYYLYMDVQNLMVESAALEMKREQEHGFSRVRMNTFIVEDSVREPVNQANLSSDDDVDDRTVTRSDGDEVDLPIAASETVGATEVPDTIGTAAFPPKAPIEDKSEPVPVPQPQMGSGELCTTLTHLPTHEKRRKRRKPWVLGVRTRMSPQQIINEICRTLQSVECEWDVKSDFVFRVRPISNAALLFNIRVFSLPAPDDAAEEDSAPRYLVDIQKDRGPPGLFLDLSAKIFDSLRLW